MMTKNALLVLLVAPLLTAVGCSAPGVTKTCLPGSEDCGNGCVQLQQDQLNCGTCGNACAGGAVCSAGTCSLSCGGGTTLCGAVCADMQTDNANCGACGTACVAGSFCVSGTCTQVLHYNVNSGTTWTLNPATFTCREACALIFGGTAAAYTCSTSPTVRNGQAFASTWGTPGCVTVADNFKLNTTYNCGTAGCSTSAFVSDNCGATGTNYCWR